MPLISVWLPVASFLHLSISILLSVLGLLSPRELFSGLFSQSAYVCWAEINQIPRCSWAMDTILLLSIYQFSFGIWGVRIFFRGTLSEKIDFSALCTFLSTVLAITLHTFRQLYPRRWPNRTLLWVVYFAGCSIMWALSYFELKGLRKSPDAQDNKAKNN